MRVPRDNEATHAQELPRGTRCSAERASRGKRPPHRTQHKRFYEGRVDDDDVDDDDNNDDRAHRRIL